MRLTKKKLVLEYNDKYLRSGTDKYVICSLKFSDRVKSRSGMGKRLRREGNESS